MSKMIVMDMDGTLLRSDGTCSEETKEYLNNLKEEGHTIVLATGRPLKSAIEPVKDTSFVSYIISNNGSLIYDFENGDIIYKSIIDKDTVKKIASLYDESATKYIALSNDSYCNRISSIFREDIETKMVTTKEELDKALDEDIIDITMELKDKAMNDDTIRYFNEKVDGVHTSIMQDSFGERKWIRIGNDGTNKYNSITRIANKLGIDNDDIICFGDGLNDLDMLANYGLSVAMGNALEEVKIVCNDRTDTNDEDGVIRYLERYFEYNRVIK